MTSTQTTTTQPRPPQHGQKAPEIALQTSAGTPWTLAQALQKGPVVVCFMPGAFTGVCTKEMCAFTDRWGDFEALGAQVVGVTVDSKHAQRAWAERDKITIPLLSDFEKKTVNAWGVLWNSPWGLTSKRCVFVVDRSGTVRWIWVSEDAGKEPNYDDVKKAVVGLK